MDIRKLRLSDFVPNHCIVEKEFHYGDVPGFAELYGWQIIFFREVNSVDTSAISMIDVFEDRQLLDFAKVIIQKIGINLEFGAKENVVVGMYGSPKFVDETIDGLCRYVYIMDSDLLVSFSIDNNQGLSGFEIIQNKIIKSQKIDFYISAL